MDDVEDSSDLRRGIPVAHKIYGVPQTINSANYVYFLAMQELYRFRASRKPKEGDNGNENDNDGDGVKGKGREEEKDLDEVITGESRVRGRLLTRRNTVRFG